MNRKVSRLIGSLLCQAPLVALAADSRQAVPCQFEVAIGKTWGAAARDGRMFVILARENTPEPRLKLGDTSPEAPEALARDLKAFGPDAVAVLDRAAFAFPATSLSSMPAGDYYVQALFDCCAHLRSRDAPGNLYSKARRIHFDAARGGRWRLELTQQVPPEHLPADTEEVKLVKLQSKRLSEFYRRPMFLRAGIILPRDYAREASRRYPLWVRIGGLNARYTSVLGRMKEGSEFRKTWQADGTPRVILLQLDGAGPYGDPYYVNSANNGPYGDALVEELVPYIESRFRAVGQPRARFLSGASTGGWVSLALQVFYPDFFNGAWASCPDPVDFRALQRVNIYEDDNAYVDSHGKERPSVRDAKGKVELTMRQEVGVENLLGSGNSYTMSGEQWGAWNAAFGPRGADGRPVPLWDPQSGRIDHAVAEQWKKYDLRLVLEGNWKALGPKLQGKLHIAAGEADAYFLNEAGHLLEQSLARVEPPFEGRIVYGIGKGHGWSDLSVRQMLEEMHTAAAAK